MKDRWTPCAGAGQAAGSRIQSLAGMVKSALTRVMDRLIPASEDVRLFLLTFAGGLVFFSTFLA